MFTLKEVIIKMMKKILLIGTVFIIICSILSACKEMSNNKQNDLDTSNSRKSNIHVDISKSPNSGREDKGNYNTEGVEGKASIENVIIDGGQINLQIKNLTMDNILISAYLEYIRLENGKKIGNYPLDCDLLNIPSNGISDTIVFNPQKPLGKEGIIKIRVLVFKDEKDNYKME